MSSSSSPATKNIKRLNVLTRLRSRRFLGRGLRINEDPSSSSTSSSPCASPDCTGRHHDHSPDNLHVDTQSNVCAGQQQQRRVVRFNLDATIIDDVPENHEQKNTNQEEEEALLWYSKKELNTIRASVIDAIKIIAEQENEIHQQQEMHQQQSPGCTTPSPSYMRIMEKLHEQCLDASLSVKDILSSSEFKQLQLVSEDDKMLRIGLDQLILPVYGKKRLERQSDVIEAVRRIQQNSYPSSSSPAAAAFLLRPIINRVTTKENQDKIRQACETISMAATKYARLLAQL